MYLLYILILSSFQILYLYIAQKYKILDKPNERSSHNHNVIRGAGIIYPLSMLLWFLFNGFHLEYFVFGLFIISILGFLDDLFNLKQIHRLIIHIISALLLLYQVDFLNSHICLIIIVLILIIGWVNTFNFMDGINGISIFYALINLGTLYYLNSEHMFVANEMIIYIIIPIIIFSFLNVRKNAIAFGGDVGSLSLAFILVFLMISLILKTANLNYILLFSIYGIDSVLTIIERIIRKENIFKPHRTHLYQYLANEREYSHLVISSIYATAQLLVNLFVIYILLPNSIVASISILIILSFIYIMIKRNIVKSLIVK